MPKYVVTFTTGDDDETVVAANFTADADWVKFLGDNGGTVAVFKAARVEKVKEVT